MNEWNNDKKLKHLTTFLRGRVWAIVDALLDTSTDTYKHLKEAILNGLSPDTVKDQYSTGDSLRYRKLYENQKSLISWLEICSSTE